VRPLPYAEGKKAGSITRDHILHDHSKEGAENLISLIGGKLTTHRQVGEEFVNLVFRKRKQSVPPCPTRKRPLPGAICWMIRRWNNSRPLWRSHRSAGAGSSSGYLWGTYR
jgi:glycerol-3-phosphate dehydrogenase